jgi:predicted CXXCH cytochrome family protein
MVNRLPFKTLCAASARWIHAERAKLLILAALGASAGLLFISCGMAPVEMNIPMGVLGAEFVGSEACADCHDTVARDFKTADHARLQAKGPNAVNVGCESCHGPGSKHVEAGGGRGTIINPDRSPETCYQCHLEIKAKFSLPYRHPVPEGKITCTNCHDPHKGGAIKNGGTARGMNETCYECHNAQRGPFVFGHEATREGCVTCHEPHGSVNAKQLVARDATLCMKCHYQGQQTPGGLNISEGTHNTRVRGGTCWSGGCHEAVHGSQVNAHLRY